MINASPEKPAPVADAIPRSIRIAAAWSWRLLLIGVAVFVLLWLITSALTIVVPVFVALLLSVLLMPLRARLVDRAHFPKGLATGICVIGLIVVVLGAIILAGHQLVVGFENLADQAMAGFEMVREWLYEGPLGINLDQIDDYLNRIPELLTGANAPAILSGALGAVMTIGHVLIGMLIAIFCTIFFLHDGRTIWTWIVNVLPVRSREKVHQAGRRGFVTLSAYVRTQVLVAFVEAVGIGVGAAFFVPSLAIPIGILTFIGAFVPFFGAVITGLIATVVVLVSSGWIAALIMLGIVLLVNQLESHILQPFLMGHAVSLHPVAVIIVVSIGTMTAGIVGAMFAVPLAAVANTVILYLSGTDKFPELGTDDHLPLLRRHPETGAIPSLSALRRAGRGLLVASAEDEVGGEIADENPVNAEGTAAGAPSEGDAPAAAATSPR
jgi:predicted PurR-regulated permease PerM